MFESRTPYLLVLVVMFAGFHSVSAQKTRFTIGSQPCGARSDKERPFLEAVMNGNEKLVERFLQKGVDPNLKDDCGISVISYAAHMIRPDLLKMLVGSGAKVDVVDGLRAETPLLRVIGNFDLTDDRESLYEAAQVLIAGGADVNRTDRNKDSMLIHAVNFNAGKLAKMLLAAGAKVDYKNGAGRTAYSYAAAAGHKKLKEILIQNGADPAIGVGEYQKEFGANAFFQAAADGRTDVVEAMLAAGMNVNAVNAGRMTALMRATEDSTVDALIAAGADVNLKDNAGFTALIWAAAFGRKSHVEKLLAAGADPHAQNAEGKTALDFATGNQTRSLLVNAGARKIY